MILYFHRVPRDWICSHYDLYNLSDLNIDQRNIELLKSKRLIAETVTEQMNFMARKVSER